MLRNLGVYNTDVSVVVITFKCISKLRSLIDEDNFNNASYKNIAPLHPTDCYKDKQFFPTKAGLFCFYFTFFRNT